MMFWNSVAAESPVQCAKGKIVPKRDRSSFTHIRYLTIIGYIGP